MVLSVHTHSPTSWAEKNAINSMNVCTAMHVWPQVMHVRAQVDSYHLRTDHPYKYISSSRYTNILQFLHQGTTPAKLTTKQLQVRSRVLQEVASMLPLV